jgi:hypothetical protein
MARQLSTAVYWLLDDSKEVARFLWSIVELLRLRATQSHGNSRCSFSNGTLFTAWLCHEVWNAAHLYIQIQFLEDVVGVSC